MKRRVPIIALLCFLQFNTTVKAQENYDSLWQVWKDTTLPDTSRLKAMNIISWDGHLFSAPDSAYVLSKMMYDLAAEASDQRSMAIARTTMGASFFLRNDHAKALSHWQKALHIHEEMKDTAAITRSLTNIGSIFNDLEDHDRALSYYEQSLRISTSRNDKEAMASAINNIAIIQLNRHEYDEALVNFEKSRQMSVEVGDKRNVSHALTNMGIIRSRQGHYDEALDLYERSLVIARELHDEDQEISSLRCIANVYNAQDRYLKAIEYGQRSLAMAQRLGTSKEILNITGSLHKAYRGTGNDPRALEMLELHMELRDSLDKEMSEQNLVRQEMRIDFERQILADSLQFAIERSELESARTIAELRAEQNRNRTWAAGGAGVLLLSGFGAWSMTDRRRRQERFEKNAALLETQALRSQMNPHFIFNALNSINAFVQQNDPDRASSYLSKFSRVMRLVLENSRHAEVPLRDDLEALRGYLDLERMRMQNKFDHRIEVDPTLDLDEVLVPPLVVQPFVENAIWHGMRTKEGYGRILIKIDRNKDQLRWTIEDDGVGRHGAAAHSASTNATAKKTSLGTAITRSRLDLVQKQYGGEAGFSYTDLEEGTRVEVYMPLLLDR